MNGSPWTSVPESDVVEWYEAGWHYVGPSAADERHRIMEWRSSRKPVKPFNQNEAELQYIATAVSALEGRVA